MSNLENQEPMQRTIKITAQIVNIRMRYTPHAWHPATDLFETADDYIIKVEIAGMSEDQISVCIEGNNVLISGERPMNNPEGAFHRLEIPYGEFNTMVEIPHDIDHKNIQAIYQNGFLIVTLPKLKPVNIKVN